MVENGEVEVKLFPAYAGVILDVTTFYDEQVTFPRIRGGDPRTCHCGTSYSFFSPHTRG